MLFLELTGFRSLDVAWVIMFVAFDKRFVHIPKCQR